MNMLSQAPQDVSNEAQEEKVQSSESSKEVPGSREERNEEVKEVLQRGNDEIVQSGEHSLLKGEELLQQVSDQERTSTKGSRHTELHYEEISVPQEAHDSMVEKKEDQQNHVHIGESQGDAEVSDHYLIVDQLGAKDVQDSG
ncbi:hypothetical protein K7X08_006864 [Anisodus acutangulus]|uniref:Uncharacterized protein n=1 Tax=Anisodus acutangulus TaxID=402998 RepID=A0A9Q1QZR4_9SOLA|nr:hypothetical protein K7X08_006864 [Anisodus acutangulus]